MSTQSNSESDIDEMVVTFDDGSTMTFWRGDLFPLVPDLEQLLGMLPIEIPREVESFRFGFSGE